MAEPTTEEASWPELHRVRRAIVVVDVVESVRLMQANEALFINRWRSFVREVREQVVAAHGGRVVKHLGDGMLLEFVEVPAATGAASEALRRIKAYNIGVPSESWLTLRIGIHVADIVVDEYDIFGVGVNLAARLASLARPGDIVLSTEARDHLTDDLHASIDDLGHVFVKHIDDPLRVFRIADTEPRSVPERNPTEDDLLPVVAILPFTMPTIGPPGSSLGHALADSIIAGMTKCKGLHLITRLSSSALSGAGFSARDVNRYLRAGYVLTGTVEATGAFARMSAVLRSTRTEQVLWAQSYLTLIADVFAGQSSAIAEIVQHIGQHVAVSEVGRAIGMPMPNLDAYTLYLGGQTLLHRLGLRDFELAHQLLSHLTERHPRSAAPHAMLAKWHVLRVVQGLSKDPKQDSMQAQFQARRALELNDAEAFSLVAVGMVAAHFDRDLTTAAKYYERALVANPHEPYAWALRSGAQAYLGEHAHAVESAERALALSPLDPTRFLLESYAAMAHIGAGSYARAVELAADSVRRNTVHLPSHKLHVIALSLLGMGEQSCIAAQQLLQMEPGLTVQRYVHGFPAPGSDIVIRMADALHDAGIPN